MNEYQNPQNCGSPNKYFGGSNVNDVGNSYGTDEVRVAELERAMLLQPEAIREHILPQFGRNKAVPPDNRRTKYPRS